MRLLTALFSVHDLPLRSVWVKSQPLIRTSMMISNLAIKPSSSLPNFPDQLLQQANLPVLSGRTEEDGIYLCQHSIIEFSHFPF